MLFLNLNSKIETETLKIGDTTVSQVPSAKLLGITIDDNQSWASQINGVGGIIPSLNSRLFLIQRLKNAISKERLVRIVDSLYTSKVRYGLQLSFE